MKVNGITNLQVLTSFDRHRLVEGIFALANDHFGVIKVDFQRLTVEIFRIFEDISMEGTSQPRMNFLQHHLTQIFVRPFSEVKWMEKLLYDILYNVYIISTWNHFLPPYFTNCFKNKKKNEEHLDFLPTLDSLRVFQCQPNGLYSSLPSIIPTRCEVVDRKNIASPNEYLSKAEIKEGQVYSMKKNTKM